MHLPSFVEDLGHGIFAIDTGFQRPRFDAAYLVVDDGRAAFIDTGPNLALPRHLAALAAVGLPRSAVEYVIPTHVHLDHAGGAGVLMRELPAATLVVHPRGQRHMIDPGALYQGALAVYGQEEMDRSYGTPVPVDAARSRTTHDGMDLLLGTRRLHLIDTPGHARHHHCIWDERTRGWFTGDTFGISYREFDVPPNASGAGAWILPSAVPTQFEPELLRASIQRLLSFEPACMYLTHYGRVADVQRLGTLELQLLDGMVAIARRVAQASDRHEHLKRELAALFAASLGAHGIEPSPANMQLLAMDVELNAQGIGVWLDRERRGGAA